MEENPDSSPQQPEEAKAVEATEGNADQRSEQIGQNTLEENQPESQLATQNEGASAENPEGTAEVALPATGRLWLNWDSLERRVKRGKWIVVTGSSDHTLKVWDVSSCECRGTLVGDPTVHEAPIRCVDVDLESRHCITGCADGRLAIWDLEECQSQDSYLTAKLGSQLCICADWSAEVKTAITGTGTGKLCLWDTVTCKLKGVIEAHPGVRVKAVAADFNKGLAISAGEDGQLKKWENVFSDFKVEEVAEIGNFREHGKSALSCLAADFERERIISGSEDGSLFLIDLGTFESLGKLDGHTDRVNTLKVDLKTMCAVTGSEDETLRVWSLTDMTCIATLSGHTGGVRDVQVDFKEKVILSASDDHSLRFWDLDGTCKGVLPGHTDRVLACRLRMDRDLALSVSKDSTLRLWDLEQLEELETFYGHSAGISILAA